MTAPAKAAPMREDVTQADREAAADVLWNMQDDPATWHNVKTGNDDGHRLVQSFKRHRLSHTARPAAGDEDVERVARAMWEASHLGGWNDAKPGTMTTTEYDRDVYRDHARAALAAMREGVDRKMVEQGRFVATIRGREGLQIDSVGELLRLINGGAQIDRIVDTHKIVAPEDIWEPALSPEQPR